MHNDGVRRLAGGKLPISCYRRYQHWSWTLAVVLACLAAVGCNSGSGGVGTPGNGAPPSPASSGSVAVATSPESDSGSGGVGTPGNGAPPSSGSVAVATSPESGGGNGGGGNGGGGNGGGGNGGGGNGGGGNGGGGNGGGGNAAGAPMNIPEVLANEDGVHSVEVGEDDVRGVLGNQYNCGPDLCNVNIVTAPNTDTSTCISNISVQGRGGYDQTNGITVYPGDTITFTGSAGPCAAPS
jgi:hypothetical protein